METPKVSIIVPVYNAGKYLAPLLDSLVGQTLREIEVILVLDCPTDGSDGVAEEYAARDGRVVIVRNRENLHVGFSRNEGLKVARGEYIGFCDHDDLVEPEMFEKLYARGKETGAEVVVADYWIARGGAKWQRGIPHDFPETEFIRRQFSELVNFRPARNNQTLFSNNGYVWNSLFKRDFLSQYHIAFPDNRVTTFEDRVFLLQAFLHARKTSHVPEALYTHVWHASNAGASYSFKSLKHVTRYLEDLHDFLKEKGRLEEEKDNYTDAVVLLCYTSFRHELRKLPVGKAVGQLGRIRRDGVMQAAVRRAFGRLGHYPLTKIVFLVLVFNPFCRRVKL